MDVVGLFGEGAEGVGVVDDGFAVLAPVKKVVRRAVLNISILRILNQSQSVDKSEILFVNGSEVDIVYESRRGDQGVRHFQSMAETIHSDE